MSNLKVIRILAHVNWKKLFFNDSDPRSYFAILLESNTDDSHEVQDWDKLCRNSIYFHLLYALKEAGVCFSRPLPKKPGKKLPEWARKYEVLGQYEAIRNKEVAVACLKNVLNVLPKFVGFRSYSRLPHGCDTCHYALKLQKELTPGSLKVKCAERYCTVCTVEVQRREFAKAEITPLESGRKWDLKLQPLILRSVRSPVRDNCPAWKMRWEYISWNEIQA